jgi:transcriptional regulator with XRE-family HTH domain
VHDPRLGAAFRAVRIRRGWRQADVADRARVSRQAIGRIESGDIGRIPLDTLERVGGALEIRINVLARWRGGELDRQINARHAALNELVAVYLRSNGWATVPAVSFSIWGERGVIDLLAWHPPSRSLLVIEIKTEIVEVEDTVGLLDRKRRLAWSIARDRGWQAASVSAWLVIADGTTNRRRVASHSTLLRSALPLDGFEIRRWIRAPREPAVAALSFWAGSSRFGPNVANGGLRRSLAARKRVRSSGPRSTSPPEAAFVRPEGALRDSSSA